MNEETGLTITVKGGPGYEAPWIVLRGSADDIREQIADAFGIEGADVLLHDLVAQATVSFQASWLLARDLGAKPLALADAPIKGKSAGPKGKAAFAAVAEKPVVDVELPADDAPPFVADDPLVVALRQVTDAKGLAKLYTESKDRFAEDAVKEAAREAQARVS